MKQIEINGRSLSIEDVVAVAYNDDCKVQIDPTAIEQVKTAQAFIHQQVQEGRIVYGVTTGFGINADKNIPADEAEFLQHNLLISHCSGIGRPFSKEIVRAIMFIRLNTLLAGHSGIRLQTIKLLLQFLNQGIHPFIPEQGSVGASGDLAPLAHMAATLIGFGKVEYQGQLLPVQDLYQLDSIQKLNQNIRLHNETNNLKSDHEDYQSPIVATHLTHKESLALINGTTVMNALGAIGVFKAEQLMNKALQSASMFAESLCARPQAFDKVLHIVRRHAGQLSIAQQLRTHINDSEFIGLTPIQIVSKLPADMVIINDYQPLYKAIQERITLLNKSNLDYLDIQINQLEDILSIKNHTELLQKMNIEVLMNNISRKFCNFLIANLKSETTQNWLTWKRMLIIALKKITPQDSYSVRCMPQVFGASLTALNHVKSVVAQELNAVVDNPIIFMNGQILYNGHEIQESRVLSGGNFHGQPLALVLDYLKLSMAELGNMLERQICKLNDLHHNDGLPLFLVENSGINSGVMMGQYAAAALVSENKVLVHPASADSIPTSANQEDHVSMGTIAGRQAIEMIGNVEKIIAIHLITSKQAMQMRIKQFDGKLDLNVSKNSQKWIKKLDSLGVTYYDKDRFLYDDIDAVIKNLNS